MRKKKITSMTLEFIDTGDASFRPRFKGSLINDLKLLQIRTYFYIV